MSPKTDTEVIIGGKVFTLSGYESEEYMQKIASYINNKINEYGKIDSFRRQPLDRQSVLLQLNIADDYFKAEDKAAIYHSERELKDRMILEMKHEMIELQDAAKEHDKKVAELEKALEEAKKKNIELETRLKTKR